MLYPILKNCFTKSLNPLLSLTGPISPTRSAPHHYRHTASLVWKLNLSLALPYSITERTINKTITRTQSRLAVEPHFGQDLLLQIADNHRAADVVQPQELAPIGRRFHVDVKRRRDGLFVLVLGVHFSSHWTSRWPPVDSISQLMATLLARLLFHTNTARRII